MSIRNICRTILLTEVIKSVKKEDEWKVLLLDEMGLRVLSSCCSSMEILEQNIALIEDLYRKREPLNQFEAIYLIQPSHKSIGALISDFTEKCCLYVCAHVFFLYAVPETMFDRLCRSRCASYIKTLKEVNVAFLPCESQVFSLDDFETFRRVYGADKVLGIEYCEILAEKIATLCCTLEEYPLIRYRRRFLSSFVLARKVRSKLEQYAKSVPMRLQKKNKTKSQLLILDRGIDCISPLLHELTLQAMVHDILPVVDNTYQVVVGKVPGVEEGIARDIALDESDLFWLEYRHEHVAHVSEMVADKLRKYEGEDEELGTKPLDKQSIRRLSKDMRHIIRLRLRRKYADYRNMVAHCVSHYTAYLKELCMVEQDLALAITNEEIIKDPTAAVFGILQSGKYSNMDKIRILLLFIMYNNGLSEERLWFLMDTAEFSTFDKQVIVNFSNLGPCIVKKTSKLPPRKVVPKKDRRNEVIFKASRWTPIIKDIMELAIEDELDEGEFPFLGGDIHSSPSTLTDSAIHRGAVWCKDQVEEDFTRLIVFMIGGATYSEARCAYEVTRAQSTWQIILGSDALMSPEFFMQRVGRLSK